MSRSPIAEAVQFQLDLNPDRRRAFIKECNERIQNIRRAHISLIPELQGRAAAAKLAEDVDELLARIHTWLITEGRLNQEDWQRIALVAQGGYGRGQLNLYSDLDLLFLMPDHPQPIEQAFVKSFLYVLWDLNKVELGNATKKISEALDPIGVDLDSSTALLNLRLIAGDEKLLSTLSKKVAKILSGSVRRWFVESKLAEGKNRQEKYGSSIYLLEPNLKEGEGGLRDVHSLQWMAYVLLGSSELSALVEGEILTSAELTAILAALDFMLSARSALHEAEGRKIDTLAFDKQPTVAAALGYESDPQLLAEEKMMKDYYLHARSIDRYAKKATRMLTARSASRVGGVLDVVRRRSVNDNYYVKGGVLHLKKNREEYFHRDSVRVMECFWIATETGVILSEELKAALEREHELTDTEDFRTSPVCRDYFMKIMGQKKCAGQTMHAMHETGVLADYMPEFGRLFCLVRIDHYHKYTVDEHLIKTLEVSEDLVTTGTGLRPELVEEARQIQRWDLLNLSLLLHDIGKGEGHGHVLRGAILSQKMTQRMGLPPAEQEVVRQLILQHLKMVHISQRRDLEDPNVIAEMAGTVPDPELLRMLYILTYCDTRAVGPSAWTDWKGILLFDLYRKTVLLLQGKNPLEPLDATAHHRISTRIQQSVGPLITPENIQQFLNNAPVKYLNSVPPSKMARHLKMLNQLTSECRAVWHIDEPEHLNYTEVTVVSQDVKGLLSWICGALSSKEVNILSLQAFSTKDGFAIDVFQVTDLRGNRLPQGFKLDRLKQDLNNVIMKTKTPQEAFPIRRRRSATRTDLSVVKPAQVILDNDGSPNYTILEVKAYDRPGLLYDVTSTCTEQAYYIHLAMITTEAYRVVDVFYITDLEFNKLDLSQIKKLRTALEAII